jgi:hypothetical protein
MKDTEFNEIARKTFADCEKVLGMKNIEYSGINDRLHNFKVAGRMLNITPEVALMGMKIKHTVSVYDIVNNIVNGNLPDLDVLNEKICDEINYLVLLKALIVERTEKYE